MNINKHRHKEKFLQLSQYNYSSTVYQFHKSYQDIALDYTIINKQLASLIENNNYFPYQNIFPLKNLKKSQRFFIESSLRWMASFFDNYVQFGGKVSQSFIDELDFSAQFYPTLFKEVFFNKLVNYWGRFDIDFQQISHVSRTGFYLSKYVLENHPNLLFVFENISRKDTSFVDELYKEPLYIKTLKKLDKQQYQDFTGHCMNLAFTNGNIKAIEFWNSLGIPIPTENTIYKSLKYIQYDQFSPINQKLNVFIDFLAQKENSKTFLNQLFSVAIEHGCFHINDYLISNHAEQLSKEHNALFMKDYPVTHSVASTFNPIRKKWLKINLYNELEKDCVKDNEILVNTTKKRIKL